MSPRTLHPAARRTVCLLLALAGLVSGCGKQAGQPEGAPPQAVRPQAKAPGEEPAAAGELYSYSAADKIDPFRPFGVGRIEKKGKTPETSPLRQMDVGQFKLVGIADSPAGRLALVQDSTGRGYVLAPGTVIGASGGVVKEIAADGMSVEQQVRDYAGRLKTKTVVLRLVQEEEE